MITVAEVTRNIVEHSSSLLDMLSQGVVNVSSLARSIQPDVEKELMKDVSEASVAMALRRMKEKLEKNKVEKAILTGSELLLRSNLTEIVVSNNTSFDLLFSNLLTASSREEKYFFVATRGLLETGIIVSDSLVEEVTREIAQASLIAKVNSLSAITVRIPKAAFNIPGIYSSFLQPLAFAGINVVEIVSTYLEITLVFADKDVEKAFGILQKLVQKKKK